MLQPFIAKLAPAAHTVQYLVAHDLANIGVVHFATDNAAWDFAVAKGFAVVAFADVAARVADAVAAEGAR